MAILFVYPIAPFRNIVRNLGPVINHELIMNLSQYSLNQLIFLYFMFFSFWDMFWYFYFWGKTWDTIDINRYSRKKVLSWDLKKPLPATKKHVLRRNCGASRVPRAPWHHLATVLASAGCEFSANEEHFQWDDGYPLVNSHIAMENHHF